MLASKTVDLFLAEANHQYHKGNFQAAEDYLIQASQLPSVSRIRREKIFDRLAAMACEQGLYATAAFWYAKVFNSKTKRLPAGSTELIDSGRNYRILLGMSQSEQGGKMQKVPA